MTLHELQDAANHRRAVFMPAGWLNVPKPAVVIMNMSGIIILNAIERGLYLYRKPPKRK